MKTEKQVEALIAALKAALPVLEDHAQEERSFYGSEDKHGIAAEAELIYKQARGALDGLIVQPSEWQFHHWDGRSHTMPTPREG